MKALFRGYFPHTEADFKNLWEQAEFAFDANSLLDLYRYKKASADLFLEALTFLKDRIWLPYQAAKEFFRNYDDVLQEQFTAYDTLVNHVKAIPGQFQNAVQRHTLLPLDDYFKWIKEFEEKVNKSAGAVREQHTSKKYDDPTLIALDALFCSRMGSKPAEQDYSTTIKQCEIRFAKKMQPGLSDNDKPADRKYGDAIIWLELIQRAKETGKPIVYITSEKKSDWWILTNSKQIIGPRKELIQEMYDSAQQMFYVYLSDSFVKQLSRMLGFKPKDAESPRTLAEDVSAQEEARNLHRIESFTKPDVSPTLRKYIDSLPTLQVTGNILRSRLLRTPHAAIDFNDKIVKEANWCYQQIENVHANAINLDKRLEVGGSTIEKMSHAKQMHKYLHEMNALLARLGELVENDEEEKTIDTMRVLATIIGSCHIMYNTLYKLLEKYPVGS